MSMYKVGDEIYCNCNGVRGGSCGVKGKVTAILDKVYRVSTDWGGIDNIAHDNARKFTKLDRALE